MLQILEEEEVLERAETLALLTSKGVKMSIKQLREDTVRARNDGAERQQLASRWQSVAKDNGTTPSRESSRKILLN